MYFFYCFNITVITVFTINMTFKNLANEFADVLVYQNGKFL